MIVLLSIRNYYCGSFRLIINKVYATGAGRARDGRGCGHGTTCRREIEKDTLWTAAGPDASRLLTLVQVKTSKIPASNQVGQGVRKAGRCTMIVL